MQTAADDTKFCPHPVFFVYNSEVCYTRYVNYSTIIKSIITVFLYSVHSLLWYQKALCLKHSRGLLKEPNPIVRNDVSKEIIKCLLEEKCCIEIKQNFLMEAIRTAYLGVQWHMLIIVMHCIRQGAEVKLHLASPSLPLTSSSPHFLMLG